MKRDTRLWGLSAEHHHALALARRLSRHATNAGGSKLILAELKSRFHQQLEPHFVVEEELLLPALSAAGEVELVRRTRSDHERLRELVRIISYYPQSG